MDTPNLINRPFLSDKEWPYLLQDINKGDIIPVVGPGLVTVVDPVTGSCIPIMQYLAPQLAKELGLEHPDRFISINGYARAFLFKGYDRYALYHDLHYIIDHSKFSPFEELLDLAGITEFNLLIASTPDHLLARDLEIKRPDFSINHGIVRFHPKLASPKEQKKFSIKQRNHL